MDTPALVFAVPCARGGSLGGSLRAWPRAALSPGGTDRLGSPALSVFCGRILGPAGPGVACPRFRAPAAPAPPPQQMQDQQQSCLGRLPIRPQRLVPLVGFRALASRRGAA